MNGQCEMSVFFLFRYFHRERESLRGEVLVCVRFGKFSSFSFALPAVTIVSCSLVG